MASFRKSGLGWRAEIAKLGFRESATFPTKREAQAWASERETAIVSAQAGKVIRLPLRDVLERYIQEITPTKQSARSEALRLKRAQNADLAKKVMQDITAADLADYRDQRLKNVKPASVLREMGSLRAVWRQAQKKEWGYVDHNPWVDVTKPKAGPPRTTVFNQAQVDRIVHALGFDGSKPASRRQETAVALLLSLETAMRAGEILSLTWENVDLGAQTVFLPKTKNSDSRYVPLSMKAVSLLECMMGVDEFLVFTLNSQLLDVYYRSGRQLAGIEGVTFHDARATAITRLSKKLDILELARMVGHRDPRSLMIYYRASPTEIAKKLN